MTHLQGKVIVIDDGWALCELVTRQFSASAFQFHFAHNGQAGLDAVREHQPDIVLLNGDLPGMDGLALCRQLKAQESTADIPVLYMTASAGAYIQAFQAGADDCVTKPVRADVLEARMQRAMKRAGTGPIASLHCGEPVRQQAPPCLAADDELRRLKHDAAEMDHVLGVLGHELRTPLSGLRAMSEYLLTDGAIDPKSHKFVQAIHDETIRMSNMVNNLLEAARLNGGNAQWHWGDVLLKAECDAAVALITPLTAEGVLFACDVKPEGLTMRGDGEAVRRLLLNLLSNAQKHTSRGAISVHARHRSDPFGQWIELSVADTGTGIDHHITRKLGIPFALNGGVTNDGVSMGLGISICKSIAAAHGGNLCINSAPGEGTVVTVRLRADLDGPELAAGDAMIRRIAA